MSDALFESARKYPEQVALTFEGKDTTFSKLVPQIRKAEKAFRAIGIKEGDVVTICMPNISLWASSTASETPSAQSPA